MKLSVKDQKRINEFLGKYADNHFKRIMNAILISKENTREHNLRICEICIALRDLDIPFFTEFRTNYGLRHDIVTPLHAKAIIEVCHSETEKDFIEKKSSKLPQELKNEVILNYTSKKFEEKDVL